MRHTGSISASRRVHFSYRHAVSPPPQSAKSTSVFRANLINARRLISLFEPLHRVCSALSMAIRLNGQSCDTRARVIPSILATSERFSTLPSLNSLAQE